MIEKPGPTKRETTYWAANLAVVSVLLAIWFITAFFACVLLIDWLNEFQLGAIGFGFWMAQQGSIFVFVVLVFVYAIWMDRVDRRYEQGE